jgi:two-component system chemotaxis response regulator CheY
MFETAWLRKLADQHPAGGIGAPPEPGPLSCNVIFADDDEMTRVKFRSILGSVGKNVILARDGVEALELSRLSEASLIVLDMHMPYMTGMTVSAMIRQTTRHLRTPIVMLTSDDSPGLVLDAGYHRVNQVIIKPFTKMTLLNNLSSYW